ncbi:MAG: DUF4197 domain-containing protein [Geobacteraceae bacterium]|nr:DUF4197 domain-containing protein [Geobacteraceae bacterium]
MRSIHRVIVVTTLLLTALSMPVHAGLLDDLSSVLDEAGGSPAHNLDDSTIARGLKEALATGTTRAVSAVSQHNGYFGNQAIKILLPEKIRRSADLLGRFGFQQQVDDFVLSMNRAAESAAPQATEYFVDALKAMSFDDARAILQGDATSATKYFRQKTGDKIYAAFKPVVAAHMKAAGVSRYYSQMMAKIDTIPFAGAVGTFDLDDYVTTKAVDGLFSTLGEEEKKIRTDPAARGTELLQKVFGR